MSTRFISLRAAVTAAAVIAVVASCTTSSTQGSVPTEVSTAELAHRMGDALQRHDKAAFLAPATGSARTDMARWWDNQEALGYTAAAVTSCNCQVPLDRSGNGTTTLAVGLHNPLDPVDHLNGETPKYPTTSYRIGLHQGDGGPQTSLTVTTWQPDAVVAPWDTVTLHVAKGADVVVAGDQSETALIDTTLPAAQEAARYIKAFYTANNSSDLEQQGFVVFVSAHRELFNRWFVKTADMHGWFPDRSGSTFPLLQGTGGGLLLQIGGARVTVPALAFEEMKAVLVHEFVHDVMATKTIWIFDGQANPQPAWVGEGLARFIETLYRDNPDPNTKTLDFDTGARPVLHRCLADGMFPDRPPSEDELYAASDESAACGYMEAASVYHYIGSTHFGPTRYGYRYAFIAADLAYVNNDTPFSSIFTAPGSHKTFDPADIEQGWVTWFHQTYR